MKDISNLSFKYENKSKIIKSLDEVIDLCELKDGQTISFHHHFREGDYVASKVMEAISKKGIKNLNIAASSLGPANDDFVELMKDGTIAGIQTSGVRGKIGEAISEGFLQTPAILRSHGGRVRAIENGELLIDVAFIAASSTDEYGNARGKGGRSECGVLSYAMVDAKYAKKVIIISDTLVPFPNFPPSIESIDVDYVVLIDEIGNPNKIASDVMRITKDSKELLMAELCVEFMESTPYYKDGFSFQAGAGGSSLAVNQFLEKSLNKHDYKISWAIGGITGPMVELLEKGLIDVIVDAQDFDLKAVNSVNVNHNHYEISTSQYASPNNKGAFVDRLDFVVLSALEIDINFNVNVVVGSDGILRGAPGGHPDAAAGAKCTIIIAPLFRGRIPTICDEVVSITTPGTDVDVLITEYGVCINPIRTDLIHSADQKGIELITIEDLRDIAYEKLGKPNKIQFQDEVVAIIEKRDGTIIDKVLRKNSHYSK